MADGFDTTGPGDGFRLRILKGPTWHDAPVKGLVPALRAFRDWDAFPCLLAAAGELVDAARSLRPGRLHLTEAARNALPAGMPASPVSGGRGLWRLEDGWTVPDAPAPTAHPPAARFPDAPTEPAAPPIQEATAPAPRAVPYDPARPLAAHLRDHIDLLPPGPAAALAARLPARGQGRSLSEVANGLGMSQQRVQALLDEALATIDAATGTRAALAPPMGRLAARAPVPLPEVAEEPWARGLPLPLLQRMLADVGGLHVVRPGPGEPVVVPFPESTLAAVTDRVRAAAAAASPDRHPFSLTKGSIPDLERLLPSRAARLACSRLLASLFEGCDAQAIRIRLGVPPSPPNGPDATPAPTQETQPVPTTDKAAPTPTYRLAVEAILGEATGPVTSAFILERAEAMTGRRPSIAAIYLALKELSARKVPNGRIPLWVARDRRPAPGEDKAAGPGDGDTAAIAAPPEVPPPAPAHRQAKPRARGPARAARAPFDWTDERIADLKRFWLDGDSVTGIAERIGHGLTPRAVSAQLRRLFQT